MYIGQGVLFQICTPQSMQRSCTSGLRESDSKMERPAISVSPKEINFIGRLHDHCVQSQEPAFALPYSPWAQTLQSEHKFMLTPILQHYTSSPPPVPVKKLTLSLPSYFQKGKITPLPIHFQNTNQYKTLFKSCSQTSQVSNGHEPSHPYGNGGRLMKFQMAWWHNIHSR